MNDVFSKSKIDALKYLRLCTLRYILYLTVLVFGALRHLLTPSWLRLEPVVVDASLMTCSLFILTSDIIMKDLFTPSMLRPGYY